MDAVADRQRRTMGDDAASIRRVGLPTLIRIPARTHDAHRKGKRGPGVEQRDQGYQGGTRAI